MVVALLFGSFNPPHLAHTALGEYVLSHNLATQVWFVVSPQNPLKDPSLLAPYEDRVNMTQLAVEENANFKVETIEQTLPKPSYTYNTIVALKNAYPQYEFVILAGSDIAKQINNWFKADELQTLVRFLYYPRLSGDAVCSPELANAPMMNVSSTEIRKNVGRNDICHSVAIYIANHKLYQTMKTIEHYNALIVEKPTAENYFQRAKLHYANNNFGAAINDFNSALEIDPHHTQSLQMLEMTRSILDFRNFDIYNP